MGQLEQDALRDIEEQINNDQLYMEQPPKKEEFVEAIKLPKRVRELFIEIVTQHINTGFEARKAVGETFNPKSEMKLTFSQGMYNKRRVWALSIHDGPFYHNFYVNTKGEFLGWNEGMKNNG